MDYFKGHTNEDLIAFYLVDLNCRMELTQYTYPHEDLEDENEIDDHVVRCQGILFSHMRAVVRGASIRNNIRLSEFEVHAIADDRIELLNPLLMDETFRYHAEVVVNYINFSPLIELISEDDEDPE